MVLVLNGETARTEGELNSPLTNAIGGFTPPCGCCITLCRDIDGRLRWSLQA